ncbi:cytochrome b561 and DOMON domain-containing protein At5g47530 [Quercus suber]|nr:cytochrome b561 and DOMON domain-containing protein At5g47530-like [Quercus suber]
MIGAQALVAFQLSNGSMRVYKSQITSYTTTLPEDKLKYDVSDLNATYANAEIIIYATLALPSNTITINQVWQDGPVTNDNPGAHPLAIANTNSKGTLDLISSPGPSRQPRANYTAPNASASRSSGRMLTWVLLRFWLTMLCGWKLIHVMLF